MGNRYTNMRAVERGAAMAGRNPEAFGLPEIPESVKQLPAKGKEVISKTWEKLCNGVRKLTGKESAPEDEMNQVHQEAEQHFEDKSQDIAQRNDEDFLEQERRIIREQQQSRS